MLGWRINTENEEGVKFDSWSLENVNEIYLRRINPGRNTEMYDSVKTLLWTFVIQIEEKVLSINIKAPKNRKNYGIFLKISSARKKMKG